VNVYQLSEARKNQPAVLSPTIRDGFILAWLIFVSPSGAQGGVLFY